MDPGLLKVATTFFLGGFVGLATITNPLSKIPLFLSLAAGMSEQRSRHEARRACVYALVLLSAFLFAGVAGHLLPMFQSRDPLVDLHPDLAEHGKDRTEDPLGLAPIVLRGQPEAIALGQLLGLQVRRLRQIDPELV